MLVRRPHGRMRRSRASHGWDNPTVQINSWKLVGNLTLILDRYQEEDVVVSNPYLVIRAPGNSEMPPGIWIMHSEN